MLTKVILPVDRLRHYMATLAIVLGSMLMLSLSYAPSVAAGDCGGGFLGLPPWYDGITDGSCQVNLTQDSGAVSNLVWRIALNVIEALMMLVGYASVVMIIVGGFFYMTATGQADKIKSAKGTILNAVIGLVIALSSVAIVNVIQSMI